MENHWKDIDILTITSRNEGLPLVALEAMANNVFVISYDVGGLKNLLIGDDGVCYGSIIPQSHHMIEALQEQIRLFQAMTQNAKNDILFQAWKRVYEKYSSKVIIKDIETIYREFNQKSS